MSPPPDPRAVYAKLYFGEFDSETADLSPAECGAWIRLFRHYMARGPLLNDPHSLCRLAGMALREWRAAEPNVMRSYELRDHGGDYCWHHARFDELIADRNKVSDSRRGAANVRHLKAVPNAG